MKINKSDLKKITYEDFGEMLEKLTAEIKIYLLNQKITFDLVVPILRSGAFTGMHIASKFGITNILPSQYKYIYQPSEHIVKKFDFPKLNFSLPEKPNILITDSNTVYGGIAQQVINDVKAHFPHSSIYFASANLDQSIRHFDNIEHIFHGSLSNEKRELDAKKESELGITHEVIIFPWESLEEQWNEINGSENV